MTSGPQIPVLGAYGLAGRAIVARLVEMTCYSIVAAGRNHEKLDAVLQSLDRARVRGLVLDATDAAALRDACGGAAFVINAVGPYSRGGAAIANTVIDCGRPYLDCANEQLHYRNLSKLDSVARPQK